MIKINLVHLIYKIKLKMNINRILLLTKVEILTILMIDSIIVIGVVETVKAIPQHFLIKLIKQLWKIYKQI